MNIIARIVKWFEPTPEQLDYRRRMARASAMLDESPSDGEVRQLREELASVRAEKVKLLAAARAMYEALSNIDTTFNGHPGRALEAAHQAVTIAGDALVAFDMVYPDFAFNSEPGVPNG